MTAICNGTDLSALIGYGYEISQEPQYGATMTALNGKDYSPKLRDRWHLKVPFIALTKAQLQSVLQLFPAASAYVTWTFYDEKQGENRSLEFKYEKRSASLMAHYKNGTEYWNGLVVELWER